MSFFPSLTDLVARALHRNRDQEDLQAEAAKATPRKMGLPTTWRSGDETVTGRTVTLATREEHRSVEQPPVKTCGSCRFFNVKQGQVEMMKQKFADRLVLEDEWKLHHLGAPIDHLGLCEQSGGSMLTSTVAKACDHHRPRGGKTGRWNL